MTWYRFLLLTLFLVFGLSSTSWTQSIENQTLSEEDLRRIVVRLYDLGAAKEEIKAFSIALEQMQYLLVQERALANRQVQTERDRTEIAEERLKLEKEKAALLQQAYDAVTKKPGFGCKLKKIFTLGLARCG